MTITGHRYEQWGITISNWCGLFSWVAVRLVPRKPRGGQIEASSAGREIKTKEDAIADAVFRIDTIEALAKARMK